MYIMQLHRAQKSVFDRDHWDPTVFGSQSPVTFNAFDLTLIICPVSGSDFSRTYFPLGLVALGLSICNWTN